MKECKEDIKNELFDHFWNNIRRGVNAGLAEYYKEKLLKESFTEDKQ